MLEKLFLAVVVVASIFGVLAVTANDPKVAETLRLRNIFERLGITQSSTYMAKGQGGEEGGMTRPEKYQELFVQTTQRYQQNLADVRSFIENTQARLESLMQNYQNQMAPRQDSSGSLPLSPSLERQAQLTEQAQNNFVSILQNFQNQADQLVNQKEVKNLMPAQLQERQDAITAQIDARLEHVRSQAMDTQKQLDNFMMRIKDQAELLEQNRRNLLGATNKLQDRTTELTDRIEAQDRALREKTGDLQRRLTMMKEDLQDKMTALMNQRSALDSIQLRERQQALAAKAESLVEKAREEGKLQRSRQEFLQDQLEDQERRIREKTKDQTRR